MSVGARSLGLLTSVPTDLWVLQHVVFTSVGESEVSGPSGPPQPPLLIEPPIRGAVCCPQPVSGAGCHGFGSPVECNQMGYR